MKLVDGLALINATRKHVPQPFSMEFHTLDRKKKTGGELKTVRNYIGSGSNHNALEQGTVTIKPARSGGHPITVHIRNIKSINGERIFW
jgi:hypothetical protein